MSDIKYQAVPDDEELQTSPKESLLPVSKHRESLPVVRYFSAHPYLIWLCHGLLLCFSLSVLAVSLCLHIAHSPRPGSPYFPYSPAETVASYRTVRYNMTPALERTEYVGFGPDVDQAWEHITYDVGDQMITEDELNRLGLDPTSLKITHPQTGKSGYRAGIQVFHKLHCLNLLRQETYKEYYSHTGGDIDVEPEDLRGHLDHCIEILRTDLMCQSDIGVYTFKYYDGYEGHWPDFSTLHTCRNFDVIRDWAYENAVVFGDEN